MKPITLQLDKLLSNPSYEQVKGKLTLVSVDKSKIILELNSKTVKTIFGPFADADWQALSKREVVAFVKEGEDTKVFDLKLVPKQKRTTDGAPKRTSRKASGDNASEPTRKGPLLKWSKYAEGRMVGEPVKLSSIQKGFELDLDFLIAMLKHLEITYGQNTKVVAYLDFRKVYHFMCSPAYRAFENEYDRQKA